MMRPCRTAPLQSASTSQLQGFKTSRATMKTSAKRTRTENKPDIGTDCDKENINPGNDYSPPKKKWRPFPDSQPSDGLQSQTRTPLGTRDSNVGSSLQVKLRPHPSVEKKRTTGEHRLKQEQLSYRKTYKNVPPKAVEPPGCESETLRKKSLEISKCRNDLENNDFLKLKRWAESRSPVCSFQKALQMKEENFERIQRFFTEYRSGTELVNHCQSVFQILIWETSSAVTVQGTGFVLLGNIVLTCFHLFEHEDKMKLKSLLKNPNITIEFNFKNSAYKSKETFQAKWLLGIPDLDVALLELIYENRTLKQTERQIIPPGLLKIFGPVPGGDGRACIVGYPAGGAGKMIDFTFIIRKEDREQAATYNLMSNKDYLSAVSSFIEQLYRDPNRENYVTYNTSMCHGASGSPVFDASGWVFGLHIGGLYIENQIPSHGVMGCAYSVLEIFKMLLGELQKNGMKDLLKRVLVEAEGNPYLEEILESVGLKQTKIWPLCVENQGKTGETGKQSDSEEEMDTS